MYENMTHLNIKSESDYMVKRQHINTNMASCGDLTLPAIRPKWAEPEMPPIGAEDEDVARERERVKSGRAQGDILTMTDLSKVELPRIPPS